LEAEYEGLQYLRLAIMIMTLKLSTVFWERFMKYRGNQQAFFTQLSVVLLLAAIGQTEAFGRLIWISPEAEERPSWIRRVARSA